jgi:hypothetical protein
MLRWQASYKNEGEIYMSLTRHPLDVAVTLENIHCIDEGDGPGNAEPYLWTLFYKIDGDTVRFGDENDDNVELLRGAVTVFKTNGQHENLQNTDVDEDDTVPFLSYRQMGNDPDPDPIVPQKKSLIKTLTANKPEGSWNNLPGIAGVVFILMEEDSLPDSSAYAGYNAFCSTFEAKINEIVNTLGPLKLGVTEDDENGIKDAIREAVKTSIEDSLNIFEAAWNWVAGPDQTLGSASFRCSHDDLVEKRQIFFEERWKEGVSVTTPFDGVGDFIVRGPGRVIENGGEWKIFGNVSATPVPQFIGEFGPGVVFSASELAMQEFRHRKEAADRGGYCWCLSHFSLLNGQLRKRIRPHDISQGGRCRGPKCSVGRIESSDA